MPPVGAEIVAATSPVPGASAVPVDSQIVVQFALPVDASSLTPATLALYQGGNQIPGVVVCDGATATFTPASNLPSDVPMRAVLAAGVRTAQGQPLDEDYFWLFSTEDSIPIQVLSHSPFAGQSAVSLSPQISMHFSEDVAPGSVTASSFQLVGPAGPVGGTLSLTASRTVTFTPAASLLEYEFYAATILGITDIAGNAISPAYSWTFQTADLGPPSLVATNPPATNPMTTGVAVDVVVTVQFSEPMDPFSVSPATLQLVDFLGNPVSGTVALDPLSQDTLTMTPSAPLKDGKVFTAILSGTITDRAGNALGAGLVWDFQTQAFQHGSFDLVETDDAGHAVTPFVAMHPGTGEALAVWRQQIGSTASKYAIYGSYYDPASFAWSAPTCFENSFVNDASEPSVAWNLVTGDAMAVWVQQINNDPVARVHILPFYGTSKLWDLGYLQTISGPTATASNPRIATEEAQGNYHVLWQEYDPAAAQQRAIFACEVDPYFFGVGTPLLLDSGPLGVFYYRDLGFAMDSQTSNAFAVWVEQDAGGGVYNLYARARSAGGWSANSVLLESELNAGNNNNNLDGPTVAIDPLTQDGLFAWRQKLGNATQAKAFRAFFQRLRYQPAGQVYSYPGCANPNAPCMIQIDKDSTNAVNTPQIAADSAGNAVYAWMQNVPSGSATMPGDGFNSIYGVHFGPGSSAPGPIQFAENQATANCANPKIAAAGPASGSFFLVFVETVSTGGSAMRLNGYQIGSGWGSPFLSLEPPLGFSSANPSLATDGAGVGLCVWERLPSGGVRSIVSNRFP